MSTRSLKSRFLENLASALLTGEWNAKLLRQRARLAAGESARWIPALVRRVIDAYPDKPAFAPLIHFVTHDKGMRAVCSSKPLRIRNIYAVPALMESPPSAMGDIHLPAIPTEGALAHWLGVSMGRMLWLADAAGRNAKHREGPLRAYRYCWVAKANGLQRLLEIPKSPLKQIQRKILAEILNKVPVHPAAHGFCPGRSIVTNAGVHCGKHIVVRYDLADFFPSVSATRVFRIFRTLGYPERVARLLTGFCSSTVPFDVLQSRPGSDSTEANYQGRVQLTSRHLPQGAPTSPAIANLAAFRLDRRLSRLAERLSADYTRYADDLTLSGTEDFGRHIKRISRLVDVIVREEGFRLNVAKTRTMRRSQRQIVAGVIVNATLNTTRSSFDRLKAILTNCIRTGPEKQNREKLDDFRAHLSGRIAHAASINPVRGRKLWMLFDRISWNERKQKERS
jgi:retron-type reverse transcriptase